MRRTISPRKRPKWRHGDLRDPHGEGPTAQGAKDREESGGLAPRRPRAGKDRADLSILFAIVGEKRRRSLGVSREGRERERAAVKKGKVRREKQGGERQGTGGCGFRCSRTLPAYLPRQLTRVIKVGLKRVKRVLATRADKFLRSP